MSRTRTQAKADVLEAPMPSTAFVPHEDCVLLPHLTLHGLRHVHATQLLQRGVHPKIVSERLGHSNISITMDTYSHVLPGLQEAAIRELGGIFEA